MSETINPMEFMKSAATEKRAKENVVKTKNITKMMVDNSGIFGGQIDDDKSQIVLQEVTETLGSKYALDKNNSLVGGIEEKIRSGTEIQITIAQENLNVLSNSVFTAINFSFKGFNEELFTSVLSAEQMDSFLPVELKGLGKYIKEADSKLSETDKKQLIAVNKEIETNDLFNASNSEKSDAAKSWGEMARIRPQNSLSRQYLETCRSYLFNSEVGNKQINGNSEDDVYITYNSPEPDDEGNIGRGEHGFSYGPEYPDFAVSVIRGNKTDFRRNSPPRWFKEAGSSEKNWYEMVDYLAECSANKTALKDTLKGVEKLWLDDNIRAKVNEAEFKLMYDRVGFRLATQKILKDLCKIKKDKDYPNGSSFLYFRSVADDNRDNGLQVREEDETKISLKVKNSINDIDVYKEELAMYLCKQKAYPNKDNFEDIFKQEISNLMLSRGLNEKNAIEKWQRKHNFDDSKVDVGTAWNFLYNCDFIESADFYRELIPLDGVRGDTVNFIFHPDAKIGSKSEPDKLVIGKNEIKAGKLADWYAYQIQNDSKFREEYERGEHRIFPKRLGVGFLDTYKVSVIDGGTMSISEALIEKKTIDFSDKTASKLNIFKDYKDMREGALNTFKFLTGQMPVDIKNRDQWAIDAQNALSLLRQRGTMPDGKILPVLDDVKLYAAMIYSSAGVNERDKLLNIQADFRDYKQGLIYLVSKGFIRSTTNQELNKQTFFGGMTRFQKSVFDYVYNGAVSRTINDLFR